LALGGERNQETYRTRFNASARGIFISIQHQIGGRHGILILDEYDLRASGARPIEKFPFSHRFNAATDIECDRNV
jgi:hypothetical protein